MTRLTLPAGQSLRDIAERLGVSVERLQRHAKVPDADAASPVDRFIEVPDGFLERSKSIPIRGEGEGRLGGMNAWLALDIEQKRTRRDGGLHAHSRAEFEQDALFEARRTYLRFEPESNDLSITLYEHVTHTPSIEVRGRAFAGVACGYAQRALLFGYAVERSRPQALSAATAALMASPKLPEAHIGMALALEIDGSEDDLREARRQIERAVELNPRDVWCWSELASWLVDHGDADEAQQAIDVAREIKDDNPFALQAAARLARRRGDVERAEDLLVAAIASVPTYINPHAELANLYAETGRAPEAKSTLDGAYELCTSADHRMKLGRIYKGVGDWEDDPG